MKKLFNNVKKLFKKRFWFTVLILLKTETKKKEFWIEYITIYISIIIVTIVVQKVILGLSNEILIICLLKSLASTFPTIMLIIFGKKLSIINKSRFREAMLYSFSSLPYAEIGVIIGYEDLRTIGKAIGLYIITYFFIGLYNRYYMRLIKKMVTVSASVPQKTLNTTKKIIKKRVYWISILFFLIEFLKEIYTLAEKQTSKKTKKYGNKSIICNSHWYIRTSYGSSSKKTCILYNDWRRWKKGNILCEI